MTDIDAVLQRLETLRNPENVEGMRRFGISGAHVLGIPVTVLRDMAKDMPTDHALAAGLWASGLHEARILASLVEDADRVMPLQMDAWVGEIDSWDLCDQCCQNLFSYTAAPIDAIERWRGSNGEFEKRAAFALIASIAVRRKDFADAVFEDLLTVIRKGADDPRNFVKKAVSWALRQTGKRSPTLHGPALAIARSLAESGNKSERWVGRHAVAELAKPPTLQRLARAGSCSACGKNAMVVDGYGFSCSACGRKV